MAAPAGGGRIYVSAVQYEYGSKFSEYILRLNEDGSLDGSFRPVFVTSALAGAVREIAPQPDGTILVGGYFDVFGTGGPGTIVRLLPDGQLDPSFLPPTFPNGSSVWQILRLADGKLLVGGAFTAVNGQAALGLIRLHGDGSRDSTFTASGYLPGSLTSPYPIRGIVQQSDGRIVLGGRFRIGTGSPIRYAPLFRLNADGSADGTFALQFNSGQTARSLVQQPDGKLVVAVTSSVYRFESNGAVDSTFR